MDTQAMSSPSDKGPACSVLIATDTTHLPFKPKAINAFTDQERDELKQIIREVLNEKA